MTTNLFDTKITLKFSETKVAKRELYDEKKTTT